MAAYLEINRWGNSTIWWSSEEQEQHHLQHQHHCLSILLGSLDQFCFNLAYSGGATVSSQIEFTLTCFIQLFQAMKHQLNGIRLKPAADRHDTILVDSRRETRASCPTFWGFILKPVYGLLLLYASRGTDLFWNMNYYLKKPYFTINMQHNSFNTHNKSAY